MVQRNENCFSGLRRRCGDFYRSGQKIEKIASENGVELKTVQAKASEVAQKAAEIKPDIIVCTCQLEGDVDIPVMNGRSFLTGINLQKTTGELLEILRG